MGAHAQPTRIPQNSSTETVLKLWLEGWWEEGGWVGGGSRVGET